MVATAAEPRASASRNGAPATVGLTAHRFVRGRQDAYLERNDDDHLVLHQPSAGQRDDVVHSKLGWIGRGEGGTRINSPNPVH